MKKEVYQTKPSTCRMNLEHKRKYRERNISVKL